MHLQRSTDQNKKILRTFADTGGVGAMGGGGVGGGGVGGELLPRLVSPVLAVWGVRSPFARPVSATVSTAPSSLTVVTSAGLISQCLTNVTNNTSSSRTVRSGLKKLALHLETVSRRDAVSQSVYRHVTKNKSFRKMCTIVLQQL